MILTNFDFSQPRVDHRQFDLKRHFEFSDARMGCTTSIQMFLWPHREKIILLEFSGFGRQIEDEQNTVSTTGHVVHPHFLQQFFVSILWWIQSFVAPQLAAQFSLQLMLGQYLAGFFILMPQQSCVSFLEGVNLKFSHLEKLTNIYHKSTPFGLPQAWGYQEVF